MPNRGGADSEAISRLMARLYCHFDGDAGAILASYAAEFCFIRTGVKITGRRYDVKRRVALKGMARAQVSQVPRSTSGTRNVKRLLIIVTRRVRACWFNGNPTR